MWHNMNNATSLVSIVYKYKIILKKSMKPCMCIKPIKSKTMVKATIDLVTTGRTEMLLQTMLIIKNVNPIAVDTTEKEVTDN